MGKRAMNAVRTMSRAVAGAVLALVLAGCDIGASSTPTPAPTPTPTPTPTPAPTPSPTVSPVVTAFAAAVAKPDFQFEGTISGTMTMKGTGITAEVTLSGPFRYRAGDYTVTQTQTLMGKKQLSYETAVGKYIYTRSDAGKWTRKARPTTGRRSYFEALFVADRGFKDAGETTRGGASLHKLTFGDGAAIDPVDVGEAGGSVQNLKINVYLWAKDDGTPAGLTYEFTGTTTTNNVPVDVTVSMDLMFTKLAGVAKVAAPKM